MSTYNRVVAADENASLAPTVRARLATEMADPTSDVGASLSGTFAPVGLLGGSLFAILGDSLANNGEGVAYWIAAQSRLTLTIRSSSYVAAYPGHTSTQIAALTTDITNLSVLPRFCLVSVGSNDAASGVSSSAFMANVESIVADLRAVGVTPVLMTVAPRNGTYGLITEYNFRLRRYASELGLPIVDAYAVLANPATEQYQTAYDSGDGIHPSAAGCKAIAIDAVASLAAILPRPADLTALGSGVNMYPSAAFAVDSNSDGLADGCTASAAGGFAWSRVSDPSGFYWQRMTLTSTGATRKISGPTMLVGTGSTTLAASASSGATSISLVASVSTGGIYKITGSVGWFEYVKITAVTGAGPYTATLDASTPLRAPHGAGASVAPGFAVGDALALGVRLRNGQASAKFLVQFTFYSAAYAVIGNRILPSPNSADGFTRTVDDAIGYTEYEFPAGADRIQMSMTGGSTDGTYDMALPFVANLTALGIAS